MRCVWRHVVFCACGSLQGRISLHMRLMAVSFKWQCEQQRKNRIWTLRPAVWTKSQSSKTHETHSNVSDWQICINKQEFSYFWEISYCFVQIVMLIRIQMHFVLLTTISLLFVWEGHFWIFEKGHVLEPPNPPPPSARIQTYPWGAADTEQHTQFCVQRIFSKMVLRWHRWDKLLNKVVFFFFAYKKYSHRFITLRLNHWWQMDYSDNVFYTFLCLDSVNCFGSQVTASRISSKIS